MREHSRPSPHEMKNAGIHHDVKGFAAEIMGEEDEQVVKKNVPESKKKEAKLSQEQVWDLVESTKTWVSKGIVPEQATIKKTLDMFANAYNELVQSGSKDPDHQALLDEVDELIDVLQKMKPVKPEGVASTGKSHSRREMVADIDQMVPVVKDDDWEKRAKKSVPTPPRKKPNLQLTPTEPKKGWFRSLFS